MLLCVKGTGRCFTPNFTPPVSPEDRRGLLKELLCILEVKTAFYPPFFLQEHEWQLTYQDRCTSSIVFN
jgi:hypothetical protein